MERFLVILGCIVIVIFVALMAALAIAYAFLPLLAAGAAVKYLFGS